MFEFFICAFYIFTVLQMNALYSHKICQQCESTRNSLVCECK